MSGGVDSSVTAALLVEQGYDVTGVYMKNWTEDLPGMKCPWAEDLADAKRVATGLGIDFKVFDFQNEYKHTVVDYMIAEYKAGRTPNPDIMCNQEVKFKLFLEASLADGAELIATGHYAQVEDGQLLMAVDANKDQTYFLYRVSQEALGKTVFPLGGYTKPEVREMARARALYTASKKDSQGICFVGKVGIRDFLRQYVSTHPGDIIEKGTGTVLGRHDGAIYYTIGQRHGLEVGGGLPYYVIGKDMDKNEVYVTTDLNDTNLWLRDVNVGELHWINGEPHSSAVKVRFRHRARLLDAAVTLDGTSAQLTLENPERAITSGQSAVLYDGNRCIGGGIVA